MAAIFQKTAVASRPSVAPARPSRKLTCPPVASGGGKTDVSKVGLLKALAEPSASSRACMPALLFSAQVGLESIEDPVVQQNLKGRSRFMKQRGWVDPQGRKGKGLGVYRFEDKYGANVDGYSPIYTPDQWADSGDTYKLGTKGLLAWAGLVVVLLGVGITLVVSTSALAQ